MKSNTYHNTTNQTELFVEAEVKNFKNQEERVMYFMKSLPKATASEIWTLISLDKEYPITSIRRAMSNLCFDDELHKTKSTKIGLYGKPEHYYELFDLDKLF